MSGEQQVGKSWQCEDHRGKRYVVHLAWEIVDGRWAVTEVRVTAKRGVDASMLRSLPLATLIAEDRKTHVKNWERYLEEPRVPEEGRRRVREVLAAARAPADDPEVLELVALTYKRADQLGEPPTKAVYEELLRRGYGLSRQQVGKLVMKCRQVGLLGPAEPRKAGERKATRRKAK